MLFIIQLFSHETLRECRRTMAQATSVQLSVEDLPSPSSAEQNIAPSEPENGGSVAETPINPVYLLGIMHLADLISRPQTEAVQYLAISSF
jgi:hypothetical protein